MRFTALLQPHPTPTTLIFATGEIDHERRTSSGPVSDFLLLPDDKRLLSLSSRVITILYNKCKIF